MDFLDRIFSKVESLQKKPVHVRRRILIVSTTTLSTLFFVVWISTFPATLERIERRTPAVATGTSPFAVLMGTIRAATQGVAEVGDELEYQLRYVRARSEAALREAASTTPVAATGTPASATSTDSGE
jgi:hypothetical protein